MKYSKIVLVNTLSFLLCACSGFFDKDNTPTPSPLVNFKQEVSVRRLWSTTPTAGVGSEFLKLVPAVTEQSIITADKDGTIAANDRMTGKQIWRVNIHLPISGGPSAHDGVVVIGTREGDIVALRERDGMQLWRNKTSSEILAPPAISSRIVLVKSIDGKLTALSTQTGQTVWNFQQNEPTLILRSASSPKIVKENAVVGFANGNLIKISLDRGSLLWDQLVAIPQGSFAIQRMVDIDADPLVVDHRVFAATYQGRVASLDYASGKMHWDHDISSYTGMTYDGGHLYATDAKSHVWAFDAESGRVDWRQNQLEARNISAPVMFGPYVVVGDEQGYLHWLNKQDGHFVARIRVDHSGIIAQPIVIGSNLYVLTKNGMLASYTTG